MRDASPKRNPEISKGGRPPYQEGTIPKAGERDSAERGEGLKLQSSAVLALQEAGEAFIV